jgi:hypothetical protein
MGWDNYLCDIYDSVLQRHVVTIILLPQAKENHQVHLLDGARAYCPISLVHLFNDWCSR